MSPTETLQRYRDMVAMAGEGEMCWWYAGVSEVEWPDLPPIPIARVVAIMTYRVENIYSDSFRIRWSEVGCFFDLANGLPRAQAQTPAWRNPVTGVVVAAPVSFREGPGVYTVTAHGAAPLLALEQPHAEVQTLSVQLTAQLGRLRLLQVERKYRGFPQPDGTLTPLGSGRGFEGCTELSFYADASAPAGTPWLDVDATYRFTLAGIPAWMGFSASEKRGRTVTTGSIFKARTNQVLDAGAYQALQQLYPDAFHSDGRSKFCAAS
jgi:hypothetical protein